MKTTHPTAALYLCAVAVLLGQPARATLYIDTFTTPQSSPGGVPYGSYADGSDMLGGERTFSDSFLAISAGAGQMTIGFPNGQLQGAAGSTIVYDGPVHNPNVGLFNGLGSVDFTQGGINNALQFDITAVSGSAASVLIHLRSFGQGSIADITLPTTPGIFDVPFSDFAFDTPGPFSGPVNFNNIGYIDMNFVMTSGESITFSSISAVAVPEPGIFSLGTVSAAALLFVRRKKN
jgi:hypothetical protein